MEDNLCPRGRELKEKLMLWEKYENEWRSPQFVFMTQAAYDDYQQHLRECELCEREEE